MMRRIDLLPQSYQEQRQQRRRLSLVVTAGLAVLLLLLAYWLVLGMRISDAENELASVQSRNAGLQAEIDSLQRFATLEAEVNAKQASLATVMAGDVDWPSTLAEIAMVLPGEIWLNSLTASAGQTEGATAVGTETAPVRVSEGQAFGRIQFQGTSLSMPGVAKWLIRLGTTREFEALWLNDATESEIGEGVEVVNFDSTLELNRRAASRRYEEGLP